MHRLSVIPALLLFSGCPNLTGAHKDVAQEQAHKYAQEMGIDLAHVSCVRQDTDGDGYVSCSLKDAAGETMSLECAGAWNLNAGCRAPKLSAGTLQP